MPAARIFSFFILLVVVTTSIAQQRQPYIINGVPTDEFPAVGIVGEESVGGFCTGTLISSTHVLTAAHCAQALLDFGNAESGTFEVGGRVYRTASVEILPTFNNRNFTDDVAILVLADPVIDIEPMELSTVPPEIGEVVTIVGFGGQGTPEAGSDGSFGEKLVGNVTVDDVTDDEFSWVFDDPAESNPAPGDSGGPVFINTGETLLVAGIVSSGTAADAELGDTSFNMRVDAYETWITETVLATQNNESTGASEPPSLVDPVPDAEPVVEGSQPVGEDVGVTETLPISDTSGGDGTTGGETVPAESAPATEVSSCKPYPGYWGSSFQRRRRDNPRHRGRRPINSYFDASRHHRRTSSLRHEAPMVNVRRR